MKPRVAIACQGGGSQTAFTAGVLKALFENKIQDHVNIVSLSGTSGGAICAFFIWYALRKGDDCVWKRVIDFWEDNTAQTPQEQFFNDSVYVLITVGSGGTAAPTSTGAPNVTPTNTGVPANPITSISMSVDHDSYTGQCPYTFNFVATFTLSQGATLTYGLEAGSETPGFQFNLPSPVTSAFGPGTYTLPFPMEFTDSVTGWVRFHVTSPVDTRSSQLNFTLTCTP